MAPSIERRSVRIQAQWSSRYPHGIENSVIEIHKVGGGRAHDKSKSAKVGPGTDGTVILNVDLYGQLTPGNDYYLKWKVEDDFGTGRLLAESASFECQLPPLDPSSSSSRTSSSASSSSISSTDLSKNTVQARKQYMSAAGLDTVGNKKQLVDRLAAHFRAADAAPIEADPTPAAAKALEPQPSKLSDDELLARYPEEASMIDCGVPREEILAGLRSRTSFGPEASLQTGSQKGYVNGADAVRAAFDELQRAREQAAMVEAELAELAAAEARAQEAEAKLAAAEARAQEAEAKLKAAEKAPPTAVTAAERKKFYEYFKEIDRDSDGLLSVSEIMKYMNDKFGFKLTLEQALAMVKEADTDTDGGISFQEFCTILKSAEDSQTDAKWIECQAKIGNDIFEKERVRSSADKKQKLGNHTGGGGGGYSGGGGGGYSGGGGFSLVDPPRYLPSALPQHEQIGVHESAEVKDDTGRFQSGLRAVLDTGNSGCTLITERAAMHLGLVDCHGVPTDYHAHKVNRVRQTVSCRGVVAGAKDVLPALLLSYRIKGKEMKNVVAAVTKADLGTDLCAGWSRPHDLWVVLLQPQACARDVPCCSVTTDPQSSHNYCLEPRARRLVCLEEIRIFERDGLKFRAM